MRLTTSSEKELPEIERPAPPLPDPLRFPPVAWEVRAQDEGAPLICTTPQGYENLSLGIADTLRWMRESRSVIEYYRETDPATPDPDDTKEDTDAQADTGA